jgi:ATP-dependent helicase/nuclease subunit B
MATIQRVFLGWDRPLLHSTVDRLLETPGTVSGQNWDLASFTLVVPVIRAVRRLDLLLHERAKRLGLNLRPPKSITTVGSLPERLYVPQLPIAAEMQQTLAWTRVLMTAPDGDLFSLMPAVPSRETPAPWIEMAGTLRRLCEDLAADSIAPSQVIDFVESDSERLRWGQIAALHDRYLDQLQSARFADPYQQRELAIADKRCSSPTNVVLIGCVDLGLSTCRMLDSIAERVTLFVGAPAENADLFDVYGRVVPGRWDTFEVAIDDPQLISAGDANHQTAAAAQLLESWIPSTKFDTSKITIGITDDSFGPLVETDLALCGHQPYRIGGVTITRTAPGRFLERVSDFLQSRSWNAFAALMRHADILDHFSKPCGSSTILGQIDAFRANHFPVMIDDPWPVAATRGNQFAGLQSLVASVLAWLKPLDSGMDYAMDRAVDRDVNRDIDHQAGKPKTATLAQWCEKLLQFVQEFYEAENPLDASAENHAERALYRDKDPFVAHRAMVVDEMLGMLQRLSKLPTSLDISITAHAAIDLVLQRLADPRSLETPPENSIEIAGWLDLTLDDAPCLIVVGLNQPFVPQAVTADAFLPGALRARLRVADNDRRFARDLYVLQMIHQTRQHRAYIVGRSGPDGSPTPPSRLLAACPSTVTLRRVRRLLESAPVDAKPKTRWDRDADKTQLPIPIASTASIPSSVSVTALRAYLECPFRFYLRYVLNLRPIDDTAAELAANQFGDLVHAAVERFGLSDDKHLTDEKAIRASLSDHLRDYAQEIFGDSPAAAVRVQISQAEKRLSVLAERQAQRMAQGWVIHKVEAAVLEKHGAVIQCDDGRTLKLKGRIDRIDHHPQTGRWAILDYKTHGHKPLEKHFKKKTQSWIDLQLPLYLLMLKALKIDATYDQVQVGYFNIPDDPDKCQVHLLELDATLRQHAFTFAKHVAAQILDGNFEPQLDPSNVPFDDFGMILQTGAAENLLMGVDVG